MTAPKTLPHKLTEKDEIRLHDDRANLKLAYRFSHEVYRRQIYKKFLGKPFLPFRLLAILIGNIQARSYYSKLNTIWPILYPNSANQHKKKKKTYRRWVRRLMAYIIEFFFEITFFLPNQSPENIDTFITLSGENHLISALREGRGVLSPGLHLGHFFHTLGRFRFHTIEGENGPEPMKLSMVGTPENEFLLRQQGKDLPNLYPIITGPAKNLKGEISAHLRANHVVFLMQDYSRPRQLRIPFIYGTKFHNFLVPTPQMLTSQYFLQGSPIIPILAIPGKDLRFSKLIIFSEINPMKMDVMKEKSGVLRQEIEKYQRGELSRKQQRGLISLLINRAINPYLLKYPFYWEEIFAFRSRNHLPIKLTNTTKGKDIMERLCNEAVTFLNQSYEPGREDDALLSLFQKINDLSNMASTPWIVPEGVIPQTVNLGFKTGKEVIQMLSTLMNRITERMEPSEKEKFEKIFFKITALLG